MIIWIAVSTDYTLFTGIFTASYEGVYEEYPRAFCIALELLPRFERGPPVQGVRLLLRHSTSVHTEPDVYRSRYHDHIFTNHFVRFFIHAQPMRMVKSPWQTSGDDSVTRLAECFEAANTHAALYFRPTLVT